MIRDSASKTITKQIFVAHSRALCENARRMFLRETADTCGKDVSFITLECLLLRIEEHFEIQRAWPPRHRVQYSAFCTEIWPRIEQLLSPAAKGISARLVWTKLHSVLKGGIEAVQSTLLQMDAKQPMAMTRDQYLALGTKHERLDMERRKVVYDACTLYHSVRSQDSWDQADRVLAAIRHVGLNAKKTWPPNCNYGKAMKMYLGDDGVLNGVLAERLYADEVQDCTPAELLLLTIAGGGEVNHLFLGPHPPPPPRLVVTGVHRDTSVCTAGDSAQQCIEGREIRFPTEVHLLRLLPKLASLAHAPDLLHVADAQTRSLSWRGRLREGTMDS